MKLTRNKMQEAPQSFSNNPNYKPLSQRRLKTKPALIIMGLLLAGNLVGFIGWLMPSNKSQSNEQVASVDGKSITRQQWMAEMEKLHGKETLQSLVNNKVVESASSKYNIDVSEKEIDMELALMRSAQDQYDTSMQNLTTEQLHQKVLSQLILEKVLTKDVIIEEEKMKAYYDENEALFNTQTTYRTNLIVVGTEEEAQSVLQELDNGSTFSVVARERSLDTTSASQGGDIGFISVNEQSVDSAISTVVEGMKAGETSKAFALSDDRYGIVHVSEIVRGQSFRYADVKDYIQRELALEQLPQTVTVEALWPEFDATWFYGDAK